MRKYFPLIANLLISASNNEHIARAQAMGDIKKQIKDSPGEL